MCGVFLDPMVKGAYPKKLIDLLKEYDQLPVDYTEEDLACIKENTAQILGLNYYEPKRVKARLTAINPKGPFLPDWFLKIM